MHSIGDAESAVKLFCILFVFTAFVLCLSHSHTNSQTMCNTDGDGQQLLLQFINCRLVRDHKLVQDDLWVRNGRIINPEPVFFDERSKAHRRIDCGGAIIAPGYIDIQINGKHMLTPNTPTHTHVNSSLISLSIGCQGQRLIHMPPQLQPRLLPIRVC